MNHTQYYIQWRVFMARQKIKLNELLNNLFGLDVPSLPTGTNKEEIKPSTFRLNSITNYFFSYHADQLGISLQDMVSMVLTAVAKATNSPVLTEFELAIDRFKHIFEAHGIPQIHAKHIIDSHNENKFPLGAMTNDTILLENYTPAVKDALGHIFGVRRGWLSGTNERATIADPIYSRDVAYKICQHLEHPINLKDICTPDSDLVLIISDNDRIHGDTNNDMPNEVMLFTCVEYVLDKHMRFRTYRLCGIFAFANIEAKICLQAVVQYALQRSVPLNVKGQAYSQDIVTRLKLGYLPADCFSNGHPTDWDIHSIVPQVGVDSEVDMLCELIKASNL